MERYIALELSCVRQIWDGNPEDCNCTSCKRGINLYGNENHVQKIDYSKENYAPKIESPYNLYEGSPGGCSLLFFRNVKPIVDWNTYYKNTPKEIFYAEKRHLFFDKNNNAINEDAWYFSETQRTCDSVKMHLPYYFTKYAPSHLLWKYTFKMADLRDELESASRILGLYDGFEKKFKALKK